jgi:hypothetical protein
LSRTSSQFWLWEGINAIYYLIFKRWTGWFLNNHFSCREV